MARYIVFDVETPNHRNDRISAIGITVVEDREIVDSFFTLVNPETSFDTFNIQLTGISPEMVQEAPAFPQLWARIEPILNSGIPVAHNAVFDLGVLKKCLEDYGIFWKEKTPYFCTVQMGRSLLPGMSHKLNVLAEYYHISLDHHQADSDSRACAKILLRYMADHGNLNRFRRWFALGMTEKKRADLPDLSGYASERKPVPPPYDPMAVPKLDEAERLLAEIYGYASFRPGQKTALESLLQGKDVVGVMPTGSGKSICYQIPALMLEGTTLVVSPLISLMQDQVTALRGRGIAAACINSNMEDGEYGRTIQRAARGEFRILYVAPERLHTPAFLQLCGRMKIPFVAVDEAHCVSQWGQDFRPSYLKIAEFISQLPDRPLVGAFTATATPRVQQDMLTFLGLRNPVTVKTGFDRPNLSFSVYMPKDKDQTLEELLRDRFRQSGIIYCNTRKTVESVCEMLCDEGFPATRYHAGLTPEERAANQQDFLFDRKRVMVATNAFGMGIDKANVSYVIHYNMPKSLEAYYQEAGRAGRDGCDADCILLYSPQDVVMARWLIEHTEPNPDLTEEQQQNVREADEERLKWMTFYARSRRCLRHDILRYFGDKAPEKCDNCSNCVSDCEHVDITMAAQMILSCIARTGQQLSRESVIALLRGEVPEDLPEMISTADLTTFGLMRDTSPERLREEMQALCDQGILDLWEEDARVPRLNQRSREVLFQQGRVTMRRSQRMRAEGLEKASLRAEDLFQALQRLRYEISGREHIAASTLLPDGTLREICIKLPRDKAGLAKVEGMGVFKANKYGTDILQLVERYAPDDAAPAMPKKKEKTGAFAEYKDRIVSEGKTEAYQHWSEKEDEQLKKEYRQGMSLLELAERHKRTRGAIRSRLKKLELV